MASEMNTQLTAAKGYNVDNMIFSKPQMGTIPNSKPEIKFYRINIATRNSDGSVGELVIPTSQLFSFGVSPNTNPETGVVNGYVMSLCLANRDGVSEDEQDWIDTFNNVVEKCKDHILENKDDIGQYELERNDLKKLNCLYYKKVKGQVVPGTGPTLYAKLIHSKKQDKIISIFYDTNGDEINPLDLVGKYCHAKAAIKIESIFVGNKISLQVKLYECEVKLSQMGMKRLLSRPKADSGISFDSNNVLTNKKTDDDTSSILGSDDENEPTPMLQKQTQQTVELTPVPEPQGVKKVVKVVKKVTKN